MYQHADENDRGKAIQETTTVQQMRYPFSGLSQDLTTSSSTKGTEFEAAQNELRRRNQEDEEYQEEQRKTKRANEIIFAQAEQERMGMEQENEMITPTTEEEQVLADELEDILRKRRVDIDSISA